MCGIKMPLQDFPLKMQGGLCARGAYLRHTAVYSLVPRPFLYGCIPAVSVDEGKRECQVGVSRE